MNPKPNTSHINFMGFLMEKIINVTGPISQKTENKTQNYVKE